MRPSDQGTLFDLGADRLACPYCDALAVCAAPYRVGTCEQQRWRCDICGNAGVTSTKIAKTLDDGGAIGAILTAK